MSLIDTIVGGIRALLALLLVASDPARMEIENGLKECTRAVRILHKDIKTTQSLGEKQHLQAQLRLVKSLRRQLKNIQKTGGSIKRKETATNRVHWDDTISAFTGRMRTGVISNLKHKDVQKFLIDCKAVFKRRIQNALKFNEAVKINTVFGGEFIQPNAAKIQTDVKYFTTSNSPIFRDTNLDEWFDAKVTSPILKELEEFQERDSGWALYKIINLGVNINKFTPQVGSSFIELPRAILLKKACVNVKNADDSCFAWAVTSALYPAEKHSDRVTQYPHYSNILNLKGIQFPMTMKQIPNFEKQNELSINVYMLKLERKNYIVLPTYLSKHKVDKHINLLLIQSAYGSEKENFSNCVDEPIHYHYVWIKSLSRLLSKQLSEHNGKKLFCDRCLHYFCSQEKLSVHYEDCKLVNNCKARMPDPEHNILKFKNFKNKIPAPFIIYADLECILKPVEDNKGKYQEHKPCSAGYYVKCAYDDTLSFYKGYTGEDCTKWFCNELNQFAEDLEPVFWCPYDMDPLTPEEQLLFNAATHCHICEKVFTNDDKKVRDHNHLTSGYGGYRDGTNYRGPAHEACNINFQDTHVVPVVFHNLSGYDCHLIIKDIAEEIKGRIDVLPITKEHYISFTKQIEESIINFRFIDSFRFMASSLEKLVSYQDDFPILRSEFKNINEEDKKLLTKKGVFCYDYMSSFNVLNEQRLPPKEQFYNKLNDSPISDDEYLRAQNIWQKFNCKSLKDYTELYLKTDVLLLADVFEKFRETMLRTHGLDPAKYITLPGFTMDACLKYTKIELELLTDPDMHLFYERGVRGGLSQCSKRYAEANNPNYAETYNPDKPKTYLMHFDIVNQYGYAMSQHLPYGGFRWLSPQEIEKFDVFTIAHTSDVGYVLEVDLEYPEELHDAHADLPFCPMKMCAPNAKDEKLLATVYAKTKYVIHYRALQQALRNGLKLCKIHRAISFEQSLWLKSYIDLNTRLRMQATNEFEKNLFKLLNNAFFGKTMENVRKRSNVKLVSKWDGRYAAEALISKPTFKSATIFSENLVAIELNVAEVYLNKPIYIGMAILDLAKTTIYDFHYKYFNQRCGQGKCEILYTDTDSLIYLISDIDPYEIIREDCTSKFDTSDFPDNNIWGIPRVNKKVLGLMSVEHIEAMTEFVGLRSKMYCTKINGKEASKKAKGVKRGVVAKEICFDDYTDCLRNLSEKTITQNLIKSDKHCINTITQEKIGLSPFDDKRHITRDGIHTLPWGHYKIKLLNS